MFFQNNVYEEKGYPKILKIAIRFNTFALPIFKTQKYICVTIFWQTTKYIFLKNKKMHVFVVIKRGWDKLAFLK